ncbi:MAG TPA: DUF6502 family protein [Candidatus Defluviicoccus seviourii]|nr:DUF6502 family protein [Candidatus Defluviicoccus seviourii]
MRRVLAPVVRLMLAKGVTLPMAIELLKRVFVDVARTDFQLDGKAPTDSRISLLTGVHRKDVRRLRELPDIETNLPEKVSLGAQVVGAWVTRTEWLDRKGRPKPLPRLASAGDAISFERLVASISRDIRPRSVLDEWLRLGVVAVNEKDEVVLNASAFIPQAGEEEKLAYLGLNVGDHAAAAVDNVIGEKLPWFERSVHHTALTPAQVDALRARAAEMGMGLLQELHAIADHVDNVQPLVPVAADGQRFTCGIYFYSAADEAGGKAP